MGQKQTALSGEIFLNILTEQRHFNVNIPLKLYNSLQVKRDTCLWCCCYLDISVLQSTDCFCCPQNMWVKPLGTNDTPVCTLQTQGSIKVIMVSTTILIHIILWPWSVPGHPLTKLLLIFICILSPMPPATLCGGYWLIRVMDAFKCVGYLTTD